MDFKLNDEQRMLEETVGRLVRDGYPFDAREKARTSELGYSTQMWQQFAELGLLGVPFAEDFGGFNGGGPELMVVAEGFGRGLVLEPYLATVVLSGTLIDALGNDAKKESLISAIVGGELRLALAAYEPEGRYDHTHVATQAEKQGDSYVISGSKAVVLHGDGADKLVVIARTGGETRGREGLSAFVVDADASGVSRRGYETIDGLRAAEIHFDNASGELLGEEGAADALEASLALGIVALCAEAAGAMEVACDQTLVHQGASAIWRGHRQVPGLAAPHGGNAHGTGKNPLHDHSGSLLAGCCTAGARQAFGRGQGHYWQIRSQGGRRSHSASRWDGHDGRNGRISLRQAYRDD